MFSGSLSLNQGEVTQKFLKAYEVVRGKGNNLAGLFAFSEK
jgi:hypothetical protein